MEKLNSSKETTNTRLEKTEKGNNKVGMTPITHKSPTGVISSSVERLYRSTESNIMSNFRLAPY